MSGDETLQCIGHGDGVFGLESAVTLPAPLEQVFAFFSDAHNLERITPPALRFHILGKGPIEVRTGTLIPYRLQLYGVPFRWLTRISTWSPPHVFVDEQLAGPFHSWHHTHRFRMLSPQSTEMVDVVRYRLPLWPVSAPVRPLVTAEVARIFAYRNRGLTALFAPPGRA